ncbi:MAG: hypothetical protein ACR2QW_08310, partial [bacterium]
SDADLVADKFVEESRYLVRELTVKLYKRNPDQLRKTPEMTIEKRLNQLRSRRGELVFDELDGNQGIASLELVFSPEFSGDRVFALIVGLGGMLRKAYGYHDEFFMFDKLDADVLVASAQNVEILLWRLKNNRKQDGTPWLITGEYQGIVDNLSFERLFGKLIGLQEMMARITDDSVNRRVTGAVHAVSSVFIPLPI